MQEDALSLLLERLSASHVHCVLIVAEIERIQLYWGWGDSLGGRCGSLGGIYGFSFGGGRFGLTHLFTLLIKESLLCLSPISNQYQSISI